MAIQPTEYFIKNALGEYEPIHFKTDAGLVNVVDTGGHFSNDNVEDILGEISSDLAEMSKQFIPKKYPIPAKVIPTIYRYQNSTYMICYIDDDGAIWSVKWDNKVCKSIDDGATFNPVLDAAPFLNAGETCLLQALLISKSGRIILATNQGRILVSDEAKTTFNVAYTFKAGSVKLTWGYSQYDTYIVMSSYGDKIAANPPREVVLSPDSGATFGCIFSKPIDSMIDAADYHIHDVLIDHYNQGAIGIWVVIGDDKNRQILISYNLGETWQNVFDESVYVYPNIPPIHPTSLLSLPDGVAMGSDELPEGIYFWKRPSGINPVVKPEDIEYRVKFGKTTDTIIGTLANKGSVLRTDDGIYAVMPFRNQETVTPGNARLYASGDGGRSWYEIFIEASWDSSHNGFYNVILKQNADKSITIFGSYALTGTTSIFKATLPKFYDFTSSDIEQQIISQKTDWQAWTPTITWTTANPTTIIAKARYKAINKTVFFDINISAANGNNAAAPVSITLPLTPGKLDYSPVVNAVEIIGTTPVAKYAYIRDDGTNNDICVMIDTATAGSALALKISGFYEIS